MKTVEKAAERLRNSGQSSGRKTQVDHSSAGDLDAHVSDANVSSVSDETNLSDKILYLNWTDLREAGLAPPEEMEFHITREFQRIKRPLLNQLDDPEHHGLFRNRLMITGANPNEGKTFSAFNLAISLAGELDYSVLLVDCDVARPGLTRGLGLVGQKGFMDVLTQDRLTPEDVIRPTDIDRLSILPAGRNSRHSVERLSSRRMESLVDQLTGDPARLVVFDSPPLLPTVEAQVIASCVGQAVLVIKAGATERRALDSALSLIDTNQTHVSLILNQSRYGFGDYNAGYYYGQYSSYGQYAADNG